MNKYKIKSYLLDWQEKKLINIKPRETSLKSSAKIQSVIGARRTGKTYLLYNKILELEKSGIDRKRIIYLNFENPALDDLSYKELKEAIDLHWSVFPEIMDEKLYLFIDEPQAMDKWESAVRGPYDGLNAEIFITGSSSRLLTREIASSLRGRSISTVLLPLSFREYLIFNNFKYDKNKLSTKKKAYLLNFFDRYLKSGAYPEIVLEENPEEQIKILKDYFDLTVYKDLIDRYKIKNTGLIKMLIDWALSSAAKEFSLNKYYLDLKSGGLKIGKNTLYEYFSVLEDSFFIFPIRRFSYSKKTESLSIPKIYLGDIGFLNLYSLENYGQRLENIVFLELKRLTIKNPLLKINYWKSDSGREVDFIISEGKKIKNIIQAVFEINNKKTKDREIKSILAGLDFFKAKKGIIITYNFEDRLDVRGKTIEFIPVWKWLLY